MIIFMGKSERKMTEKREQIIRLWLDMWLKAADLGILDILSADAVYTESWGPEYRGAKAIQHWFAEWNTRGRVLQWDIKQFFHTDSQTVVEWYFKNTMNSGTVEAFEGMSLIRWDQAGRICALKEFGCNENRYDPYQNGPVPRFRDGAAMWF